MLVPIGNEGTLINPDAIDYVEIIDFTGEEPNTRVITISVRTEHTVLLFKRTVKDPATWDQKIEWRDEVLKYVMPE